MIQTEPIPFALLLMLTLTGLSLFAAFWLVQKFIYPLIKIRRIRRLTEVWLFRAQLISWGGFALFGLYRLLLVSPAITLSLLALTLFMGWPFWKDFLLGILFRLDNQVTISDTVRIGAQESNVESIGWRNLISSNTAGETIITPYHKLNDAIVTRARAAGKLVKHTFTIQVSDKRESNASNRIKQYLQECPWSAPLQTPIVKNDGAGAFQVTTFASDNFAAEKQKAYMLWRVDQDE
jgi:small-conductance mechanosensitive channel